MEVNTFCRKLAQRFDGSWALINDFKWIVECGESNAYYGYNAQEIFNSNSTAKDLMRTYASDPAMEKAILGCAKVGFYRCAEDEDMVKEVIEETLNSM